LTAAAVALVAALAASLLKARAGLGPVTDDQYKAANHR
jgi:hypothetical protein